MSTSVSFQPSKRCTTGRGKFPVFSFSTGTDLETYVTTDVLLRRVAVFSRSPGRGGFSTRRVTRGRGPHESSVYEADPPWVTRDNRRGDNDVLLIKLVFINLSVPRGSTIKSGRLRLSL